MFYLLLQQQVIYHLNLEQISTLTSNGTLTATEFSGGGSGLTGITASQVGALADVVSDTTPQLGGDLDLIVMTLLELGNVNITGTITATSFVGDGSGITGLTASQVGALADVVSDTTPQLGGDLDLNSNNITGTGNVNITGTITASGDIQTDGAFRARVFKLY